MKRISFVLFGFILTSALQPIAQAQTASASVESRQRNVAILIYDGVQIIDYTGPFEVFGATPNKEGNKPAFNIYTVSEKGGTITTAMGMSVNAKYSFENVPKPDILFVPGGGGSMPGHPGVGNQINNPAVLKWVQETAKNSEIVMSDCNGAFILAYAGLLDGLEATTTTGHTALLEKTFPKIKVRYDKRFVDTGKIITTAGFSSGIDGTLHLVEKLFGRAHAQQVALSMEYNWDPESKFVRGMLADKYLRFKYDTKQEWKSWEPISRSGGTNLWENKWFVVSDGGALKILESVNHTLENNETYGAATSIKWVRQDSAKPQDGVSSLWKFTDEKGNQWVGLASVEPVTGEKDKYTLAVKAARGEATANLANK